MDELTIEILTDDADYDLLRFDCGEEALNLFLTTHLVRQHRNKILRAYILRTNTPERQILGYYTLSGSCFERAALPSKSKQKNIPSVTLGRLAIDRSIQGQGWGATLVAHAMKVVWSASLAVGIHGLFVEALNEKAHTFYQSLGFIPLVGENENALFFPTKSIELLFTQSD
ncbi:MULTISPECIES: GNAT family N-acetyltransferase [Escherichia]|uniref:GNAT family N-acetyltransferase n=1 Tax=Escherichia TaxID=561 RepID=UPI0002BAA0CF|nr:MULTISPECIES: GNAT family N-acetyltransferase [Escherichia]EFB2833180.1 GNAT family N-acetyltransferase [Escherichia coli]EFC1528358.1 GNAT family N-acetyltransferase [Escherichia coli]EFC9527937.1 GNAT family N-acetyltransferase [Escherichia coli]EFE0634670.1 GNAT family N-acetyltransferase [Escherichia coli]EFN7663436.1 GNAT family N-acetyltransferase [Escherichia coli]